MPCASARLNRFKGTENTRGQTEGLGLAGLDNLRPLLVLGGLLGEQAAAQEGAALRAGACGGCGPSLQILTAAGDAQAQSASRTGTEVAGGEGQLLR